MPPRVYLAGPDVFFPNPIVHATLLKAICKKHGLEGVFPFDGELDFKGIPKKSQGAMIFNANISLIRSCRAVLANMSPFRGPSMDVGTAFEMGYGKARNLIVVGYTDNLSEYNTRVAKDGLLIEDFEMVDNLMVHSVCQEVYDSPEKAIRKIAETLDTILDDEESLRGDK